MELVTWEQYKKSDLPDTTSDSIKEEFLKAMLAKEKQFNRKVDYNTWQKKTNPTWEEKIDYITKKIDYITKKMGIKYTKSGVKL